MQRKKCVNVRNSYIAGKNNIEFLLQQSFIAEDTFFYPDKKGYLPYLV